MKYLMRLFHRKVKESILKASKIARLFYLISTYRYIYFLRKSSWCFCRWFSAIWKGINWAWMANWFRPRETIATNKKPLQALGEDCMRKTYLSIPRFSQKFSTTQHLVFITWNVSRETFLFLCVKVSHETQYLVSIKFMNDNNVW